jgi:hypothetical protein
MNYSELVKTVLAKYTENHLAKVTELQLILCHPRNHYNESRIEFNVKQ